MRQCHHDRCVKKEEMYEEIYEAMRREEEKVKGNGKGMGMGMGMGMGEWE